MIFYALCPVRIRGIFIEYFKDNNIKGGLKNGKC